jgi:hypothetical protein
MNLCVATNSVPCIEVSGYEVNAPFPYKLSVVESTPRRGCTFDTEPNNQCNQATALVFVVNGNARYARVTGALSSAVDVDVYSITSATNSIAYLSLDAISDQHPLTGLTITVGTVVITNFKGAINLNAGVTCVSIAGNAIRDYNLDVILFPPVPPNDEPATAIPILGGSSLIGSNFGATTSTSSCNGEPFDDDVWYSYVAACNGDVTISLCGSLYDTFLAVYQGSIASLLACNDDQCGQQSAVQVNVTSGATYLIRVGGWSNSVGVFSLSVSQCV